MGANSSITNAVTDEQLDDDLRKKAIIIATLTKEAAKATLAIYQKAEYCACGNKFMGDSVFCRKCGVKRPKVEANAAKEDNAPESANATEETRGDAGETATVVEEAVGKGDAEVATAAEAATAVEETKEAAENTKETKHEEAVKESTEEFKESQRELNEQLDAIKEAAQDAAPQAQDAANAFEEELAATAAEETKEAAENTKETQHEEAVKESTEEFKETKHEEAVKESTEEFKEAQREVNEQLDAIKGAAQDAAPQAQDAANAFEEEQLPEGNTHFLDKTNAEVVNPLQEAAKNADATLPAEEVGKMSTERTSQHCWKPGQGRLRRHLRSVFCMARS